MLPQLHRLKQSEEIGQVFRRGKGFFSPFLSAKYMKSAPKKATRLAFSFSKKYVPKAVHRNRLKRVLIGELQKVPDFFSCGVDVVFFLQKPINFSSKESKKELKQSIECFLKAVYTGDKLKK